MDLLASIEIKISASAVLVVVPQCVGEPGLLLFSTDLLSMPKKVSKKASGEELNCYLIWAMQDMTLGLFDPDDELDEEWQTELARHLVNCFKRRVDPKETDPLGLNPKPDEQLDSRLYA